jgi:hypothetical protein
MEKKKTFSLFKKIRLRKYIKIQYENKINCFNIYNIFFNKKFLRKIETMMIIFFIEN